jgi:hypothetical protein
MTITQIKNCSYRLKVFVASMFEYCSVDITFCAVSLKGCMLSSEGVVICKTANAARYVVTTVVDQKAAGTEYCLLSVINAEPSPVQAVALS